MTAHLLHAHGQAVAYCGQPGLAVAVAGAYFTLDLDHLVHGADRLISHLGKHLHIARIATQRPRGAGGSFVRSLGG